MIEGATAGRNAVVEKGHFIIVGYSEKCIPIIGELAKAMDSDGGGTVVVLSDAITKAEFETRLHQYLVRLELDHRRGLNRRA